MKFSKIFAAIAVAAVMAACGGAHAADLLVKSDANSATTVNLGSARWVDLTPGAQTMTLANGQTFSIRLAAADVALVKQTAAFAQLINTSGNVYFNSQDDFTAPSFIWCQSGVSYIQAVSNSQNLSDNCAFANVIYSVAK